MENQNASALPFADNYEIEAAKLNGAKIDWLAGLRRRGIAAWRAQGVPVAGNERWKYTRPRALEAFAFKFAEKIANPELPEIPYMGDAARIVLVNGVYAPELSSAFGLPEGVKITSLASYLNGDAPIWLLERLGKQVNISRQPFAALNTAYLNDGYVIDIPANVSVKKPILIVSCAMVEGEPKIVQGRGIVHLGRGASASLIEYYCGKGNSFAFTNFVTEICLEEDASLKYYRHQNEASESLHVSLAEIRLARGARLDGFALQQGAQMSRCEQNVTLAGEGASCRVDGVYMVDGNRHSDMTTFVDHLAGRTNSEQRVRGVIDDEARGVFQGKILVRKDSQKIDGNQNHKALLLSGQGEVDCKPELEIYADDVKCSHGATSGALDDNAMFYLLSRGIGEREAKGLLVAAFLAEVVETITDEAVRDAVAKVVENWLKKAGEK